MHHRIPQLLGTHAHNYEVMMAKVKTNFAKKETVLFKPSKSGIEVPKRKIFRYPKDIQDLLFNEDKSFNTCVGVYNYSYVKYV